MVDKLPTSTGELAGCLNHQHYEPLLPTLNLEFLGIIRPHRRYSWFSSHPREQLRLQSRRCCLDRGLGRISTKIVPLVGGGYDWGLAWDFFKPLKFMYLFDGFFPEHIWCHGIHHHFAVTSLGEYIWNFFQASWPFANPRGLPKSHPCSELMGQAVGLPWYTQKLGAWENCGCLFFANVKERSF